MEKTIQLDQKELQAVGVIEQELTLTWAQVGMLSEQLEQARKARDTVIERQRGFMRQALTDHGIQRFDNARPTQGGIIVTIPDEAAAEVIPPPQSRRANGAPSIDVG